ncbi:MAG: hypothetical protein HFJ40_06920 [Clostridia bacterium]|nr:hypothetical protein [Clostridia bacterium]
MIFNVLKSNLKCAFCKNKNCSVRYYPERMKTQVYGGTQIVTRCKKDQKAYEEGRGKLLKKPMP